MSFNQFLEGLWWSLVIGILILATRDIWLDWRKRHVARSVGLEESEERVAGRL